MAKEAIIEALGERQLLLPGLIAEALQANDRVKYLLTLIQGARAAADGAVSSSLREERLACAIEDPKLDAVIAASTVEPDGRYRIPGAQALAARAIDELRTMLLPLRVADAHGAQALCDRTDAIEAELGLDGDLARAKDIELLTAPPKLDEDSLHAIVMDAHRGLDRVQERIATESIDGARAHDLHPSDRPLVRAFMRGLHRTERLRLRHPGLGTVATHVGRSLMIQNDIGETDAHVVVIRVSGRAVTITYTDVHLQRLLFFQRLMTPWSVDWEDTRSRTDSALEGGLYHLASGRLEAKGERELEGFLEHLGSRLVFMIDWNRARKRLRRLVGKRATLELLTFAAEHEYGHVAFLSAGADALIYDALQFAGGGLARAGESLEDVLGAEAALSYMRTVLRICSEGLGAGAAISLVQDEVRAELTGYLRSAREQVFTLALRHAQLSVEIAEGARDAVEQAISSGEDSRAPLAARSQRGEQEADEILGEARSAAARSPELQPFLELLEAADDIADCLEEACFYATLLPANRAPTEPVGGYMRQIAAVVLAAAREYLRAVQLSAELRRGGPRAEIDAFLEAAHAVIARERDTDSAQRDIHRALASAEHYDASLFVTVELTRSFEEAADALMHSAHLLRRQTLGRVVGSDTLHERTALENPRIQAHEMSALLKEYVYEFDDSSGVSAGPEVIGNKAYGLERMLRAGLRVPEAAVLKTSLARGRRDGIVDEHELRELVAEAVSRLEARTGLRLGGSRAPLLLSVRSGAPVSMPGMLDTVIDVGACERSVLGLIAQYGNPRLAWDCYRRFVESYAAVVHGCPREPFEQALQAQLRTGGASSPRELSADALEELTRSHLERFARLTGTQLPQDPLVQLTAAVLAVLGSWESPRAAEYRRIHGISEQLDTAVILQRMVFGNAGAVSGAGVAFTRDPALGERGLYMDFLLDAQGEDVVGGRHRAAGSSEVGSLAPLLLEEIEEVCGRLEREFGDAQEFELTVQEGELFILQTRTAKRTPWAALRMATDQVREGLISRATALGRLERIDLDALKRFRVDAGRAEVLCRATPASIGVAVGPLVLDSPAAERLARAGTPPVLVRQDALTEDLSGLAVAAGLLTATGSRTSHAAVVARELDKPCLVGCQELEIDLPTRTARIGRELLAEGESICLDAEAGIVMRGSPEVIEERPHAELAEVASWRVQSRNGDDGAQETESPPGSSDRTSRSAGRSC